MPPRRCSVILGCLLSKRSGGTRALLVLPPGLWLQCSGLDLDFGLEPLATIDGLMSHLPDLRKASEKMPVCLGQRGLSRPYCLLPAQEAS